MVRVVIPVKPFAEAKQRLAAAMDGAARAKLAKDLFRHVFRVAVEFAGPGALIVVSRSQEILEFAKARGARGLPEGSVPELNAALGRAAAQALEQGVTRLLVVASDLPLLCAHDLATLAQAGCSIAADRHGRGTNALLWPLAPSPGFHFGDDSLARHRVAAGRLGFAPRIVSTPGLAHDLDVPADLTDRFGLSHECARSNRLRRSGKTRSA